MSKYKRTQLRRSESGRLINIRTGDEYSGSLFIKTPVRNLKKAEERKKTGQRILRF